MALGTGYPYGMREIVLTPITNNVTEALGTPIALPAARKLKWGDAESFTTLRGNDSNIATRGSGPSCPWELEGGGYNADAIKTLYGGSIIDAGVTPNQIRTFSKKSTDSRPYFKAEGRAISDSGGDVHVVLYRCRCTSDWDGEFADQAWFITNAGGEAFPSVAAPSLNKLFDIIQNETEDAII